MRLSLAYQVLIAVLIGLITGVFFGPLTSVLKPIASIFIMLLQMAILPYIAIWIVHGLGSMVPATVRQLFKKCAFFWALLWGLMFFLVFLLNTLIPKQLSTGSTFNEPSPSLKEDLLKNILNMLVPENPIGDFVNNIVPAIAVFGMIVGIALMFIEKKEPLMGLLERGKEIIEKIFHWLLIISPIGVFAHVAIVSGTINLQELHQFDFYLASLIILSLVSIFWILPTLLSSLTPMTFKEALGAIITVCLITFFTGITIIALPIIHSYLQKLSQKIPLNNFRSSIETIVPMAYSFAQIGNCLFLFFILFASFYFRFPLSSSDTSLLAILTIPISVGSSSLFFNGGSFLFKEMNFPDGAEQLFSATAPLTMNFQASLSMAGAITFILLTLYANNHLLQIKWKSLITKTIGCLALLIVVVFAIRPYLHLEDHFSHLYMNRSISETVNNPVEAKIYTHEIENPYSQTTETEDVFERVLRTGVLRVGYDQINNIPYVYSNQKNELAGFDIALAYQLARDLNCRLEFIPIDYFHLAEQINNNQFDIAMSAMLITEERIQKMNFCNGYADQNFCLIVPIKNKEKFADFDTLQHQKRVVIGAYGMYVHALQVNFPLATLKEGNWEADLQSGAVDAVFYSRIVAIVWCLNHPDYYVQEYGGKLGKCFFGYPIRQDAFKFLQFVNNWLQLKIQDGFYQKQVDYWIMGKSSMTKKTEPRWSVLHNVLHWIE